MSKVTVTAANFRSEVLDSSIPVLLDFWATWCGPCRMIAPILDELAVEYEGKIKVGKVNVDDEPVLANQFRISSIPTLILIKDGKTVQQAIGYRPKQELEAMLDAAL